MHLEICRSADGYSSKAKWSKRFMTVSNAWTTSFKRSPKQRSRRETAKPPPPHLSKIDQGGVSASVLPSNSRPMDRL